MSAGKRIRGPVQNVIPEQVKKYKNIEDSDISTIPSLRSLKDLDLINKNPNIGERSNGIVLAL